MTALQTPAADAPASEWGALAVSLPGFRWMSGMKTSKGEVVVRVLADRLEVHDGYVSGCVHPSPDHPATAGCLLALLGRGIYHIRTAIEGADGQTLWQFFCSEPDDAGEQWSAERLPLGRAAIAAAAALGRWPGGEG